MAETLIKQTRLRNAVTSHSRTACRPWCGPRPCDRSRLDMLKYSLLFQLLRRARFPFTLPPTLLGGVEFGAVVPKHITLAIHLDPGDVSDPVPAWEPLGGAGRATVTAGAAGGDPGPGVVPRGLAAVGHMEPTVEAGRGVQVHDDELDDEVEAVEACLGLVPGWIGRGSGRGEVDGDAEGGAEAEDEGGEEEQGDFRPVLPDAEFLRALGPRGDEGEEGDGNGEKGEEGSKEERD